jgi:mannosyltransferase OCH1-like enzyme
MIEKNIYQTYFTKELPGPVVQIIERLIQNNPGYTYSFFDDKDMYEFINSSYDKDIVDAYNKLQIGAAKADYWRYLVLYKNGGVYLDIDSSINYPIDLIIDETDKALFTRERNPVSFVQFCLFICKEHPVLLKIIEAVTQKIHDHTNAELDYITGPIVMSQAIEEHYKKLNLERSLWYTEDYIINNALTDTNSPDHARFMGYDYNGLVTFKHQHSHLLYEPYMRKTPWKVEQQQISTIKNTNVTI